MAINCGRELPGAVGLESGNTTMRELSGKIAIVTGAGKGLGKAIATRLARDGCLVAVNARTSAIAEDVSRELSALGGESIAVAGDVSKEKDIEEMVRHVCQTFGRIDILVNNAGIQGPTLPIHQISREDWDQVLTQDLTSVFLCMRAVLPVMIEHGYGKIVSLSSAAGKEGTPFISPYNAAKAGIIGLTKTVAKEVASYGINVNCIAPTVIDMGLTKGMGLNKEQVDEILTKIPLGRLGKPEEVASLVRFLVSDESAFVTGQCYDLSGGRCNH